MESVESRINRQRVPAAQTNEEMKTRDDVFESDLVDLVERKTLALLIPRFIPAPEARRLASLLRNCPHQSSYEVEPTVRKVGTTFFDSNGKTSERDEYHRRAQENIEFIRRACRDITPPVDTLMQRLQRESRAGIRVEHIDGRQMSVGVCRLFTPGSRLRPHRDVLSFDAPEACSPRELVGQLSANIYLDVADEGGEVVLWGDACAPERQARQKVLQQHEFDEEALPAPRAVISPRVGDLLIFNSTCLHAVRPVMRGERITFATFIGYRGPDMPWTFWS